MKFGICINPANLQRAIDAGADYVEFGASGISAMSDEDFEALKVKLKETGTKAYSCNGLVPGSIRLTGNDVDFEQIKAYAKKTFARLAEIGIKYCVFGSSSAKNVPEGFSFDKAMEQLVEVAKIFSDEAKKYGQMICIEPLRRGEANIINTVEDGVCWSKLVGRDNFKVMADFYHVYQNEEPLAEIEQFKDHIFHFHMAAPISRDMPLPDRDKEYIEDRIKLLKKIGFNGGMSLECGMPEDPALIKKTLDWFRDLAK